MTEHFEKPQALRVLLVGNYLHDRQESMQRFSQLLARELPRCGIEVEIARPEPFLGRLRSSPVGLGKWLGYFDKFVIFPLILRRRLSRLRTISEGRGVLVHICDHSNAFYCGLIGAPTLVTCHDLLAVRGALGEDTDCPATRTGRVLQRMILAGLKRADFVLCVSAATRADLLRLGGATMARKSSVALLGQNHPYKPLPGDEMASRLASIPELADQTIPYILNVGLNLQRKNRRGSLRILSLLRKSWNGRIVFAGEPLDAETKEFARSLGVLDQVIQIAKPSDSILEALYNRAFALVYPSKCEGFGWPIIEAQACGCPVVCSDRTAIPEVAGAGAIVCALEDEAAFAAAILSLSQPDQRARLVKLGFSNLDRFRLDTMIARYTEQYMRLTGFQSTTAREEQPALS